MCTFRSEGIRFGQMACALLIMTLATRGAYAGAAAGGDWPNYRGPTNDGISTEKTLIVPFPQGGPKQVWKASVGEGYSGVTVAGGRAYTIGNTDGNDTIWCLDAVTGKEVWKHSYACPSDKQYPGPRAAPVVEGGKVYTMSRKGHLFCLDTAKGAVLWQKDARQLVGTKSPGWDLSGSPLVVGNAVVYNLNENGVGLDKASGNVVWKSNAGSPGYATPVPFDINGAKGVAVFGAKKLYGLNPATGAVGWSFDWDTSYDVNSIDPVFLGDKVFISSGYGRGCAGLQIKGATAEKLWENKEIASHWSNCIGVNGCVFGFNGQNGGQQLKCMDIATGAVKWTQQGMGGTMILVDGKLVLLSQSGKLTVAETNPQAYKELASAKIMDKTCWTGPAFAGGKLYARNKEGDLVCVDLSGK